MTTQFQINLKKNGNTPLKMENYAKALLTQKGILRLNGASNNAFAKSRLDWSANGLYAGELFCVRTHFDNSSSTGVIFIKN